jgi:4-hydroxythreonine-4-phosphate dehydrogenase
VAIGITMGDACGVGPEIILKTYMEGQLGEDFIVIGDYDVLEFCKELLKYDIPLRRMEGKGDIGRASSMYWMPG